MKKLLLAATVAAVSTTAVANDYRFEVDADFLANEVNKNADLETYAIGGTFYLAPVDDSMGPKAEAAFLNKSSDIHLGYGRTNLDAGIIDEDGDIWTLGGRFVTGNGIILEADYAASDIDNVSDTEVFGLGIGYYLNDTSTISLGYVSTEDDKIDFEDDIWSVGYKTLLNDSINLEADFDYSDPKGGKKAYGLTGAADYYLNENASIGGVLGYVSSDDDFAKAWVYGVRGEYFFSSMIAVNAGYTVSAPDKGDDNSIWSIGLTARF
ncbi:putative porin [Halieaceae bacterium IMCC14734]|uniref:Porin n=1 Tax=Candidatus Litorirhabdus singularis TaxID=2518993 RepID=A0ABT3TP16_9GAMM|nr:putative porin [Candidatus Litorirhabdus singularis]MCX2983057.1 putative porin [Candidatus Litorirhabdus singularis]